VAVLAGAIHGMTIADHVLVAKELTTKGTTLCRAPWEKSGIAYPGE
jgi:hypothetical protein